MNKNFKRYAPSCSFSTLRSSKFQFHCINNKRLIPSLFLSLSYLAGFDQGEGKGNTFSWVPEVEGGLN